MSGMTTIADLLPEMLFSPRTYRDYLMVRGTEGPAPFSTIEQPFQTQILSSIDQAFLAIQRDEMPPLTRIWFEGTKGTGKDTLSAIELIWLMAFTDRDLTVQIGAADKAQADELRRAAVGILKLNEWLLDFLEIQNFQIINKATGSRCEIVPADETGAHGSRPDVVVINELTHHASRGFAETMMDNAAKVPTNVTLILTNHGCINTWQWEWRELARTSPRWAFHSYIRPAPWISRAELEDQRKRTSESRYRRLWEGEWVGETESALTDEMIEAAILLEAPRTGRRAKIEAVFGGLDIGVSRDRTGFSVLTRSPDERTKLAECQSWKPESGGKVNLQSVEDYVLDAHRRYDFLAVFYDPAQCEHIAQRLQAKGVPMVAVPFTIGSLQEMATALLETFNTGTIEIWNHQELIRDLRALRFVEKGNAYRLDAARTAAGHADLATAFILAILACKRHPMPWFNPYIERELLAMTGDELREACQVKVAEEKPKAIAYNPHEWLDKELAAEARSPVAEKEQPADALTSILEECGVDLAF